MNIAGSWNRTIAICRSGGLRYFLASGSGWHGCRWYLAVTRGVVGVNPLLCRFFVFPLVPRSFFEIRVLLVWTLAMKPALPESPVRVAVSLWSGVLLL